MICSTCSNPLRSNAKFCDQCGKPLKVMNSMKKKASNKLTVLIIDDDPTYRDAYSFKFKKEGFDVILARNGKEGLESARTENPSVILLDILMPDMSGLDVLRELKEDTKTKRVPVVLATILNEKADIERGLALGAEHYITKDEMTADDVVARVRSAAMN